MFAEATTIAAQTAHTVKIDDLSINFIVGAVIPLLVGIVTKLKASSGLKSVLNFGFSAVAGVLTALIGGNELSWREFTVRIATVWITSVIAYYGIQKPTGLAGSVASLTSRFGIGEPSMQTDELGLEDLGTARLEAKTTKELMAVAKGLQIKGRSKMDKYQLIDAIQKASS